jgi:hypothetical protein
VEGLVRAGNSVDPLLPHMVGPLGTSLGSQL